MKINKLITAGIIMAAVSALALDYVDVIDVKARQRYPWNGLVDIDFELDSKATEPYQMKVTVFDNDGKTNLPVKTVYTEGVSFSQNPTMVKSDTSRIIWDASADLPNGFKCTNVLVTCQDERTIDNPKRYMIIDLSAGANAVNFPVTYTNLPPAGGWTEEHMTTKLVLRRVEAQKFYMGSPVSDSEHQDNESYHIVKITKPYYIGVFELTSKQFSLIYGGAGDNTQPVTKTWDVIRGFDSGNSDTVNFSADGKYLKITQEKKATSYCWPNSSSVDSSSFMGKLRAKTGLNFDLPTEAQWECACRAGALTPLYNGSTNSAENSAMVAGEPRPAPSGGYYIYVGNSLPNAYGIYDMCGNVGEWCLDVYEANLGVSESIDPKGANISYGSRVPLSYTAQNLIAATIVYRGIEYKTYNAYYNHLFQYTAYGINRVVRGCNKRAASRTFALSINTTVPVFTDGIKYRSSGGIDYKVCKATYSNPAYGIRIALQAQ